MDPGGQGGPKAPPRGSRECPGPPKWGQRRPKWCPKAPKWSPISTKVDLNVSPGSFIDISTKELNSNKIAIINDNLGIFKRLGRISDVSHSELNKNGIKIIVGGETIILYFDQNLDLNEQKQKISNKIKDLDQKITRINRKLKNKSFLRNAPKQIVQKAKKALTEYKIELKKLNSIVNSIKN